MPFYRITTKAQRDLVEIWTFIAMDKMSAAYSVKDALYASFNLLASNPSMGRVELSVTKASVRFWTLPPYPNYIVAYRIVRGGIQIVRVVHGRRNLPRLKF